jgi:MFS family permease
VADLTAPAERGRAYGWLSAFDSAGILFGPLVGGVAQVLGGAQAPFAACAALGLLAVLLLLVTGRRSATPTADALPAIVGAEQPLPGQTSARAILRSPALWAVALPGLGMAYLNGLYTVIWSLYLQRTGASLWQINLSYTLFAVPLVVLMVPFGALGDRVGRPLMVALGGIGSVLAVLGYGLFPIPNILIGLSVMDGVAAAMFSPASQAFMANVTPPAIRGKFIGLVGSITTGATVVAATLIGYLFDRVSPMWLFAGGAVALAFSTSTSVIIMMRYSGGRLRASSHEPLVATK